MKSVKRKIKNAMRSTAGDCRSELRLSRHLHSRRRIQDLGTKHPIKG